MKMQHDVLSRLRAWILEYPPILWMLGLGAFINVGGLSLLWPVNSIYIHSVLDKPLTVAGFVLSVYSGAGFVGSCLGGWLYDRIGATPVLLLGLVISALVILVPVVSANWYVYVLVMAVFGTVCAIPFPVLNALAGHAWPEGGRRAFNFVYVVNNLGVAAGTAIGGVLAQWSFTAMFIGISVANFIFAALVLTVFRKAFAGVSRAGAAAESGLSETVSVDVLPSVPWVPIGVLFLGFTLAWSIYVQWQSTISVYIKTLGYPLSWYSLLWTLNGALIFVLQPMMSLVIRRVPALGVHMVVGTVLYALAYALLMVGHAYPIFVAGMVVMTLGELFVWPSVPTAVTQLAPPHRLGLLQGMVGSCATLGRMIGPVVGGCLYDHVPINTLLLILSAATVVPALCFVVFGRLCRRSSMPSSVSMGA
jgi:predicted MFS family arabinose efflux permease